jgi:hypothetical protein
MPLFLSANFIISVYSIMNVVGAIFVLFRTITFQMGKEISIVYIGTVVICIIL